MDLGHARMVLVGLLCVATLHGQALTIDDSRLNPLAKNIESGQYAKAYELATDLRLEWEGEAEFDVLYGIAAVETGHYAEAIFALERAVLAMPDVGRARLELARAYYLSGQLEAAEREFQRVKASQPPPQVAEHVERFLQQIHQLKTSAVAQWTTYVGLGLGSDSNINAATTEETVNIPDIGDLLLDDFGRELDDNFVNAELGSRYRRRLTKYRDWWVAGHADQTNYAATDEFDMARLLTSGGTSWGTANFRQRISASLQQVWLDGEAFQRGLQANAGADWQFLKHWSLHGQISYSMLTYPDQSERDLDQWLLYAGIGFNQQYFLHRLGLLTSTADTQEDLEPENGRDFSGANYTIIWQPQDNHDIYLRLSYQDIEYDDVHSLFAEVRSDEQQSAALGWKWRWREKQTLSVDYSFTDNQSSLDLYDYQRSRIAVSIRQSL